MKRFLIIFFLITSTAQAQWDWFDALPATLDPSATSLMTDLEAVWKFDEVTGNAIDSYGENDLTAGNAPGSTTGVIGTCRTFVRATPQWFEIAGNSEISTGDFDFTYTGKFYLANKTNVQTLMAERNATTSGNSKWTLIYNSGTDRIEFYIFNSGTTSNLVTATTFGSPPTGTWFYLRWGHNNTTNQTFIEGNNTGENATTLTTVTPHAATLNLYFATQTTVHSSSLDGRIDNVKFWKKILSTDEQAYDYNAGAGRTLIAGLIL